MTDLPEVIRNGLAVAAVLLILAVANALINRFVFRSRSRRR